MKLKTSAAASDLPVRRQSESGMAKSPSDVLPGDTLVNLAPGSVVCCGIYGVFQHTGIYVGDDTIIELHGSGLVKGMSLRRFLDQRSGSQIFVAADSKGQALTERSAIDVASALLYSYSDYDVLNNNCHRFTWACISGNDSPVTTFGDLNQLLSRHFDRQVYWDVALNEQGGTISL